MKEGIRQLLGRLFVFLQPQKAKNLAVKGMTIGDNASLTLQERLMRNFLLVKAEKDHDYDTLAEFQRNYWLHQGKDFFARTDASFRTVFLPDCAFVFDILEKELAKGEDFFHTLVEIGTGNGSVLSYLATKFDRLDRCIGIDLSQEQIKINRNKFRDNPRLDFEAADAFEWVEANGRSNMIFVTSMGVLEYFTEKRLQNFLNVLGSLGNIFFVAIEPNGNDHDFHLNPGSQPYGHERSFSHNYPVLFANAGFELWHHSTKFYEDRDYYFSFVGAGI